MQPILIIASQGVSAEALHIEGGLPGEESIDVDLLAFAHGEVQRLCVTHALAAKRAIGGFLLSTFFAGEFTRFHARSGKHATFVALCRIPGVPYKPSYLWYCVAITEQLEYLPVDVGEALPVSHHRQLVHVRDEKTRQALARESIGLSKRELAERIREVQPRVVKARARAEPMPISQNHELSDFVEACRGTEDVAGRIDIQRVKGASKEAIQDAVRAGELVMIALEDAVDRLRDMEEEKD